MLSFSVVDSALVSELVSYSEDESLDLPELLVYSSNTIVFSGRVSLSTRSLLVPGVGGVLLGALESEAVLLVLEEGES